MKTLDFKSLNDRILSEVRILLPEWLPGGKLSGRQYTCSSLLGGKGSSLSVNVESGLWKDFATGESGGDLISLYAAINSLSQKESFDKLSPMFSYMKSEPKPSPRPKPKPVDVKISKPPQNIDSPKFNPGYSDIYTYNDVDGSPLFYIARYDKGDKKSFLPYSYCSIQNKWVNKHYPSPRPVYNLDLLSENPSSPVLLVEGEKAVRAAEAFAGSIYIVVTWPGGSSAVKQTDWSSISGRRVLIWPDADDPGRKCAGEIARILKPSNIEVKMIDTSTFNGGMDAADFGFKTMDEFVKWAKPKASVYKNSSPVRPEIMSDIPLPTGKDAPSNVNVIHVDSDQMPAKNIPQAYVEKWNALGLELAGSGMPHANSANMVHILRNEKGLKDKLWYDEFYHKYLTTINWTGSDHKTPREWEDSDDIELMCYVQSNCHMPRVAKHHVVDAVLAHSRRVKRNEPKQWIKSLKHDGESRVDNFFSRYLGANSNEYTRSVSKNFWVSMMARVMDPGCKVDNMVILEGPQGRFKSTALSVIGGDWYVETNENPSSKDFFQIFQGKLLVEIGELDSFNKAETTKIKAVISTATDRFRPPYGRAVRDFPRQCVLVGTTNESNYLRDSTGGRRFWPIAIGLIDIEALKADREQLYAEAYSLYKSGADWHTVPSTALAEQEARREEDPWEPVIASYVESMNFTTIMDVAQQALDMDIERVDTRVHRRIARSLRVLGWTRKRKRIKGAGTLFGSATPSWVFIPPEQ